MKNTKRVLAFLVGAAMMLPMASAEGKLASGNYEATSQGFGGAVTVNVTVTDGKVTAATITGDKETETIGGAAIKTLTEKLIGVSSADEVDAVASATVTSNAVKTALADCLRQAAGEEKTETALVDGVYTGEGRGFNLTQKVQVTVEIKDGKIVSVTVGDNGETMGMIAAVEEKWIPRVVENQSLAVDAICGATASSNGVRAAVVNALESAGMDVSGMYKAIPKVNAAEEYNVDIVVVGMGSSGTTAALAADHNDMPRVFAKRWAKNDMPVGAAVTSGVVASCVCVLGVLIEMASPDSSLFWSFFALNLVMLLLSYLPVFPAFLKLRREDAKTPRPFRVPGSDTALKWIAYVPMVLIVISIIFTAVPLSFDAETLASFLPITIGSILSVAIGEVLIALRGKNARS